MIWTVCHRWPLGDQDTLGDLEKALHQQRQCCDRERAFKDHPKIVEPDPCEDRLTVPSRADPCAKRGRTDIDDR
jgi:hypothetical protein